MYRELINKTQFRVRFSEVDSMQVVWHGNYMKFLEDGREGFGKEFEIGYMDCYAQGFITPIVHSSLDFKSPLRYGDHGLIETKLIATPAAKIIFEYRILNEKDKRIVASGKTIQVFLDEAGILQLNYPDFFLNWMKKHNQL